MKVLILYFSGTGNTKIITDNYIKSLNEKEIDAKSIPLESIDQCFSVDEYDKIGFAYPIHGFNAPKIVLDKAKLILKAKDIKNAFILMVSGEPINLNHSSSWRLKQIIKKRNIKIESEYHYIMPYNMIFRHTEAKAYKMYDTALKLIPIDIDNYFINNKVNKLKKVFLGSFYASIVRIEQPFAPVNGKLFKVDTKKCIKCMKCVNNCPTKNIVYENDKFKFRNKCVLCTRCSFNCPTNAFSIGILNLWKVNGKYKFKEPTEIEAETHKRYCKKAYSRYFSESEKRISEYYS